MVSSGSAAIELVNKFPVVANRDPDFAFAGQHEELTWEKQWWRFSGTIEGELLRNVCRAWSCEVGDLLAPIADRHWSDFAYLDDRSMGPVFGYRLQHPGH